MVRSVLLTPLLILTAVTPSRVTIAVLPTTLLAGGTIRITCTVPRHPDNRWLTIAVPGYVSSGRQLDGEAERVTHTMYVEHVPCDVTEALCVVTDALGREFRASRPIVVAGCDQE